MMIEKEEADALATVVAFVLIVPTWLFGAWVLSVLWVWFVVPALHAPAISMGQALGLDLVVQTFRSARKVEEEGWGLVAALFKHGFLSPTLVLALGWVAHHWGSP